MEYTSLSQYHELIFEFSLEEIVVLNGVFGKRCRKPNQEIFNINMIINTTYMFFYFFLMKKINLIFI